MHESILAPTDRSTQSPFDSIRRFDAQGSEYWMARELMKLLEYVKWERFEPVVQIGLENLSFSVENPEDHSFPVEGSFGKTKQKGSDFRLSRLACYHITLACDSRGKPAVKAAKHYFATKTREAEIRAVPSEQLQLAQLENENIKLKMLVIDLHGAELGLTILGKEDRIVEVEKVSTEVVNPATGRSDKILTAEQLKAEVARKTGQKIKSMKQFIDRLKAKGRDDLLIPVTRNQISEYVLPDRLDEAIAIVYGEERQALLTPAGQLARQR